MSNSDRLREISSAQLEAELVRRKAEQMKPKPKGEMVRVRCPSCGGRGFHTASDWDVNAGRSHPTTQCDACSGSGSIEVEKV